MDNSKYQEICRLCLAEEKAKVPIFQEKEILMKITSCLPIKVFKDDQLPKKICEECFIKVDTFYEFRNNTANAEKQLYDWLVQINSDSSTLSMSLQLHDVFVKEEQISQELRNSVEVASVNSQEVFESDVQEERDGSSWEDDDNDNDAVGSDEGEGELQPTTFVNVSLECGDEAGPSGMRDEERKEEEEVKEDPIELPLPPIESSSSAAPVGIYKRNTDVGKISGAETQRNPEQLIEAEPYKCSVCGKMFKTLKWYKRHSASHIESSCFTCDLCNKSFKHNSSLKSHFREVHSTVKLFSCLLCTYATNNKSNFASHRRIMHSDVNRSGIQCDLCEVKCFREEDIMRHKIKEHGAPRFKCVVCSKSYTSRQYLNIHQAIHRPDFKPEHQCVTCGKMFPNAGHLSNHVRRRHLGLSYECSVCKKSISSLSSLKDHMSIHTGVKPHVCDICGKAFGASKYLRIHMRSHTGERPYSCRHCGKAFTQRGSLTIHLRYHTGDRPYKCRLCLKGFVAKSLMKSHLKAHK